MNNSRRQIPIMQYSSVILVLVHHQMLTQITATNKAMNMPPSAQSEEKRKRDKSEKNPQQN